MVLNGCYFLYYQISLHLHVDSDTWYMVHVYYYALDQYKAGDTSWYNLPCQTSEAQVYNDIYNDM